MCNIKSNQMDAIHDTTTITFWKEKLLLHACGTLESNRSFSDGPSLLSVVCYHMWHSSELVNKIKPSRKCAIHGTTITVLWLWRELIQCCTVDAFGL